MLAVSWDTVRLFLHVLAATVWVGGQITLAVLFPGIPRLAAAVLANGQIQPQHEGREPGGNRAAAGSRHVRLLPVESHAAQVPA